MSENRPIFRRRNGKMLAIPGRKPYLPHPFSRLRTSETQGKTKRQASKNRPI